MNTGMLHTKIKTGSFSKGKGLKETKLEYIYIYIDVHKQYWCYLFSIDNIFDILSDILWFS